MINAAITEERRVHTRLLNLALGIEESRAYWAQADPSDVPQALATRAFEQRWFGAKSERRIRVLLTNLRARYDRFPEALPVLHQWRGMDPSTRRAICHWHAQLADPLYRSFASDFLLRRRGLANPSFGRDVVIRWVNASHPGRWGASTVIQFASKLLSAASEAGLITPTKDPRTPLFPTISDASLGYLLYLLRGVGFSGTLADNPYLASVGLDPTALRERLRRVPGVTYRRMAGVDDFDWQHPSLAAWAEGSL